MLALTAFAIKAANGDVPAIAPADFQAGLLMGYYGVDVKTDMETCFGEDQEIADATDAFIAALKAKDWTQVENTIKEFIPKTEDRVKACETDQYSTIHHMYDNQSDTVKAAKADPDWQLKILKIVMKSKADITGGVADAETKWDSGDYYGAGEAIGKVERMVADPWFIPLPTSFLQ